MDLSDAHEDRLNLGISRFIAGALITYHGVLFYTGNNILHVDSFSDWEPERTSEEHAKANIQRSKDVLFELSGQSSEFNAAVGQLQREFTLCHNYGMGSIALAKEIGGVFQWVHRSGA